MAMDDDAEIGALLDELYASISGPAGPRDLARELALFHPTGRLMRTGVDGEGRPWLRVMTPEEYHADTAKLFAAADFYEIEIARRVEPFGNIAWVRSVYEARRHPDDEEVLFRGINSLQLYHDGERWSILGILWDNERPGVAVPEAWRRPERPG